MWYFSQMLNWAIRDKINIGSSYSRSHNFPLKETHVQIWGRVLRIVEIYQNMTDCMWYFNWKPFRMQFKYMFYYLTTGRKSTNKPPLKLKHGWTYCIKLLVAMTYPWHTRKPIFFLWICGAKFCTNHVSTPAIVWYPPTGTFQKHKLTFSVRKGQLDPSVI